MSGGLPGALSQRIDQWLWFARIAKSRTLAQALIERGKVRINRERLQKPSQQVKAGDVVTISLGPIVRILEISGIGKRRGPASEAALLYVELTPGRGEPVANSRGKAGGKSEPPLDVGPARPQGAGRPTKRDRRALDRLKDISR
ncbi:MAG: RNA-binding S4 domain-containing protein [Hyphomicrobium sp.]